MNRQTGTVFIVGGIMASLIVIGVGYYFFDRQNDPRTNTIAASPFQNAQEETIKISDVTGDDPTIVDTVKKVSNHIVLPDGRVTIVTILDVGPLLRENPVFYQFAKKGDIMLLYSDRAILYNPEVDRVVDVWHNSESVEKPKQ